MVEHEESLVILGGYTGSAYSDKIYKWADKEDGGQWIELPSTLSEGRYQMTAIKVKPSSFKSC